MDLYFPLEGVRVLAMEQYIAAPYCTMWLADSGAEVIKIERPGSGDPRRTYPPAIADASGRKTFGGFVCYNRNKKSLALDVQSPKGRELYRELVRHADVVVENLKPGTADKLGVGYESLQAVNPRLIYAAISGFGRMKGFEGVYSDRPVFDAVAQGMSGIMDLIGDKDGPPLLGLPGLADLFTGVVTAYEITLALFMRERTGVGQFIDASMYDDLVALNERAIMLYTFARQIVSRGKERFQAPMGAFKAKDGWVALITPNDTVWANLCEAIERADLVSDPRTATGPARAEHDTFVREAIEAWMATRTKDEVVETLNRHGAPAGAVQTAEDLVNCPHLKARGMLLDVDDPVAGTVRLARTPVRMSRTKEVPGRAAPGLGEHTDQLLTDLLGYDAERIRTLKTEKVIQ